MPVKPLRVRQAEATRSLLIEVARESFTEHGYAATSIDDIIQQAGVAPSTVYLIEAGRTVPRLSVVRRLATALGVPPATVAEFRHAIEAAQAPRTTGRPRIAD